MQSYKKFDYFIGINVSKLNLDATVLFCNENKTKIIDYLTIDNNDKMTFLCFSDSLVIHITAPLPPPSSSLRRLFYRTWGNIYKSFLIKHQRVLRA